MTRHLISTTGSLIDCHQLRPIQIDLNFRDHWCYHRRINGIRMNLRETYEKKMQGQLSELKAEIAELKEKADQAETNLQLEYYTLIDELHLKMETANQKFHLLKQASDENWDEFKSEFELIWDSVHELIQSVTSP